MRASVRVRVLLSRRPPARKRGKSIILRGFLFFFKDESRAEGVVPVAIDAQCL
jgi:hypothetical protein